MVLTAMYQEIGDRKNYLDEGAVIDTIYFGGGTPSLLSADELNRIFDTIHQNFEVKQDAEITLEANPDDLTSTKIKELRQTPINRLSVGVQSFFDEDLKLLNRVHSGEEAKVAILRSQDAGLENITLDLIYAIPGLDNEHWKRNIATAIDLQVLHISAYCLTVEEKTPLEAFIKKGQIKPVDEEVATDHFRILMDELEKAGFEHYEISNFAKEGFHSRHNSSYWAGEKYLGIGPSAHSYDLDSRQWNIAHNIKYANAVQKGEVFFEHEVLSDADKVNEFVLTRLRLSKGLDLKELEQLSSNTKNEVYQAAQSWLESRHLTIEGDVLRLTREGKLFADRIASDLFI